MYAAITENSAKNWILFGISSTEEGARSTVPAKYHATENEPFDLFQVVPCTMTLAQMFAENPLAEGWAAEHEDDDLLWCLDGRVATLSPRPNAPESAAVYAIGWTLANPCL